MDCRSTMNVFLTQGPEKLIQEKTVNALYYSASEVVREGLRLLQQQDQLRQRQIQAGRAEINRGLREFESGEGIPGAEAVKWLRSARLRKTRGLRLGK